MAVAAIPPRRGCAGALLPGFPFLGRNFGRLSAALLSALLPAAPIPAVLSGALLSAGLLSGPAQAQQQGQVPATRSLGPAAPLPAPDASSGAAPGSPAAPLSAVPPSVSGLGAAFEAPAAPPPPATLGPVVVELFTSQGCVYCPPADALLAELAQRPDVLPLALHVDYWDYIGWPDSFADPRFTRRQKAYAGGSGHRSLYTPQMVVDGVDHVVGYRPLQTAQLIAAHFQAPDAAEVRLTRIAEGLNVLLLPAPRPPRPDEPVAVASAGMTGGMTGGGPAGPAAGTDAPAPPTSVAPAALAATPLAPTPLALAAPAVAGRAAPAAAPAPLPSPAEVYLVRFRPTETVAITHGENAGRTISYANIVTDWQRVGAWDGTAALELSLPLPGPEAAAVIVQLPGAGPILGAGALR